MSYPKNSSIFRSTRGASRLGRRLPNCTRNGKGCRKNRAGKKSARKRARMEFAPFFLISFSRASDHFRASKLYEDRHVQPVLGLAKIWQPGICWRAIAGREAAEANEGARRTVVATRRCYTAGTGEVRHIGRPMVVLPAESNVLAGHPVESSRYIPGLVRIARILREVGRP